MPERLLPFLGVVAVITVVPGPDMALATRNGMRGGSRAAWYTGLGCSLGLVIWGVTAVVGVAALLAASGRAFDVLRIAGAIYLAVLGAGALRSAMSGAADERGRARLADAAASVAVSASGRAGAGTWFRQGLISNLLNPKIALLFLTLLPQFVAPGEARAATTAELAAAMVIFDTLWWAFFSLAVGAIGQALARPRVRRAVEGLAGVVLIGLAVRVAVDR